MSQISHFLLHCKTDRMVLVFSAQLSCQLSRIKGSLKPKIQICTILSMCMIVLRAQRGSSVCSSQRFFLRWPLRQTGGLWKPLTSTLQSVSTSILCLHRLKIPLNQPAAELVTGWVHTYWWCLFSTHTRSWEGSTAQHNSQLKWMSAQFVCPWNSKEVV